MKRWIRIDQPHPSFDCSNSEFEAILTEARFYSLAGHESVTIADPIFESNSGHASPDDDSRLLEAINAELAELATLQRSHRFLRAERERSEHEIGAKRLGELTTDSDSQRL